MRKPFPVCLPLSREATADVDSILIVTRISSPRCFDLSEDAPLVLEFDYANVIPGQTVTVAANGQEVARFADLPVDATQSRRIPIAGQKGRNVVTIACSDWNHGKTTFAATDLRPMALFIRKLRLVPEK